jgi:2-phospho-L-lactate guanylyltransferase
VAQALVPLKDLVAAKSRLAGLLCPSERRALAQAMVEDVLAVLSAHTALDAVTLLSDDPAADLLAHSYGVRRCSEGELGCRGLNAVVARASARLLAGAGGPLLVLHGDLPLLTAADVSAALQLQRVTGGLVIGCDRHGTGTNLLAFDAGSAVPFCFGPDSCVGHQAAARAAAIPVAVLQRRGIALDVDQARDLAALLDGPALPAAGRTAALLCGAGIGARLDLALATLTPQGGSLDHGRRQ